MRQWIAIVMIIVLMNSSDNHSLNHSTCSDGNPAPYHITQPSTNNYVQIVSLDAPRLTLMCSLNSTIPSGMTITWLHDNRIEYIITAQVDQNTNTTSLLKGRPRSSHAGVYQCVFNDNAGCILSANITLLILELQSSTIITSSPTPSTTVAAVTNSATVNSFHSLTQFTNHSITDTLMTNDITTIITTSTVDLNVITTAAHTIAQSVNHNGGSFTTIINTFITTDVTMVATKSTDLSITAITNSTNTITMFSSSPTLSTSQSNDRSIYSSVGALVVIAVVLLVVFIIVAVVMIGIIVVCYKRKRRKRCTKERDAYVNSIDKKLLQGLRPPVTISEPVKFEGQGKKDPNTKGILAGRAIMEEYNYCSIPFQNQVKIKHKKHCQVKLKGNPAYFASSRMNTSTDVDYYMMDIPSKSDDHLQNEMEVTQRSVEVYLQAREVMNKESCPLGDSQITSMMFDHDGGEISIKEHAVKVTIPPGAIDNGYKIQIQAAASLFGPFITPEGYYPISAYVWVGANYEFKEKLRVEIEHDIDVTEKTNLSELCVLTASEEDKCDGEDNEIVYKMREDTCEYQYDINKSTCVLFTSHFCSKCLASKAKKVQRITMYHYLSEDYKSAKEFFAEISFCYGLQFCRERTEERYAQRKMKQDYSTNIQICNWKKDRFLLQYSRNFENWEICHIGFNEITADKMNFRKLYKSVDDLVNDEDNDRFPPHFKLLLVKKDTNPSSSSILSYAYTICIQSKRKQDELLTLNISGFGHHPLKDNPDSGKVDSPESPGIKSVNVESPGGPPSAKPNFNSLQSFAEEIANAVDVDWILPIMVQRGLLTSDQQKYLSNPCHTQELSSIVIKLPEDCVDKFKSCLLETSSHEPHKQLFDMLYKYEFRQTAV